MTKRKFHDDCPVQMSGAIWSRIQLQGQLRTLLGERMAAVAAVVAAAAEERMQERGSQLNRSPSHCRGIAISLSH